MGPRFGIYVATSVLVGLLAIACAPTRAKGRSAHADTGSCRVLHDDDVTKGVATEATWLTVEGFDTRMHMPPGWQYAQQGSMIVASSSGHRAEYVVAGTCTQEEAKQLLVRISKEFELTITGDLPEREVTVNGMRATRLDFSRALVRGTPARGVALVADSPRGTGYIVVLGYVREGHESLGQDLREALESLSPS